MIDGIIGEKLGMTQVFAEDGESIPVTVLSVGPCSVVEKKTLKRDGYCAVQICYKEKKEKHSTKAVIGHYGKNNLKPHRYLREIRGEYPGVEIGQVYGAEIFEGVKEVLVSGTSKGKGFAGVMKRHNFSGGGASHGSGFHRSGGSIGASAYPSRVLKGTKMPGHMGNERVSISGVKVVRFDAEKNLLYLKGGVPGPDGSILLIKKSV